MNLRISYQGLERLVNRANHPPSSCLQSQENLLTLQLLVYGVAFSTAAPHKIFSVVFIFIFYIYYNPRLFSCVADHMVEKYMRIITYLNEPSWYQASWALLRG